MEFDSTWYGAKRSKHVARLRPMTIRLIEQYGLFYGIDPDQLIEFAVNQFLAKDNDFSDYVIGIYKGADGNSKFLDDLKGRSSVKC